MGTTFSCALFDVDGTVVDSAPTVVGVFEQTLRAFDLPVPERERLRAYVGPPLWYSFGDLGHAPPLLERLIATYRDLYSHCFLEPRPFEGIEGLFAALRGAGVEAAFNRRGLRTLWIAVGAGGSSTGTPGYPRPAALIHGLDETSTPRDARALLGDPEHKGEDFLRYAVRGRYVHLEFADGTLTRVTLMTTAP